MRLSTTVPEAEPGIGSVQCVLFPQWLWKSSDSLDASRHQHQYMVKQQRQDERHKTFGLMSFISDGKSSVLGIVEDLSAKGLRIGQVPLDFNATVQSCKAVIHSPTGDFNILLKPRWEKETNRGMYKTIGFQIIDPPSGWTEFIRELESGSSEIGLMVLDQDDG